MSSAFTKGMVVATDCREVFCRKGGEERVFFCPTEPSKRGVDVAESVDDSLLMIYDGNVTHSNEVFDESLGQKCRSVEMSPCTRVKIDHFATQEPHPFLLGPQKLPVIPEEDDVTFRSRGFPTGDGKRGRTRGRTVLRLLKAGFGFLMKCRKGGSKQNYTWRRMRMVCRFVPSLHRVQQRTAHKQALSYGE
ncbi:MAG: hypothetical protein OXF02_03390 [Simkaniaceae bacterium]|nr:hypothetical protein [Simkaniaceae bacterium]